MRYARKKPSPLLAAALLGGLVWCAGAAAQRPVPDTFTATTTGMVPADETLKIQVLTWSDESAREAVLSVLTGDADVSEALTELPTLGYVWTGDSPVGYAVKYAHREGERITVLTDRPIGIYDLDPWRVVGDGAEPDTEYSVVELRLDSEADGVGSMSLAADVVLDEAAQTVSLNGAVADVLTGVRLEPKPYWAAEG